MIAVAECCQGPSTVFLSGMGHVKVTFLKGFKMRRKGTAKKKKREKTTTTLNLRVKAYYPYTHTSVSHRTGVRPHLKSCAIRDVESVLKVFGILPPSLENQMEKKMENDMETGIIWGL